MKTPIGYIHVESQGSVLTALEFHDRPGNAPTGSIRARLEAYFGGELDALAGIEVELGGTPFQHRVWEELRRIPVGETISYGELARRIGRPKAVRAVGGANHQNPIGLVVPCHRVIGADGSLTGYGGGLHRKEWLLAHERGAKLPLFASTATAAR
jgi:methylated-DNA-[protein]-cysteine S-methyltransferase